MKMIVKEKQLKLSSHFLISSTRSIVLFRVVAHYCCLKLKLKRIKLTTYSYIILTLHLYKDDFVCISFNNDSLRIMTTFNDFYFIFLRKRVFDV